VLVQQRASRWSVLLGLRVREVSAWTNAGPRTVAELLGLVLERSLLGLASAQEAETPASWPVDLAILFDHEHAGSRRALLDALEELSGDANPEIVRAAALRLLRVTSHDADQATALRDILAAAGDPRDIDVFVGRTLELGSRPTIDELAERFGVCAERIRQIRTRAETRVRAAAAAAPPPIPATFAALRSWLGAVVPMSVADDVVCRLGAGSACSRSGGLLLWLAGPYHPVTGRLDWLALDPVAITTTTADSLSQDGGVRPAEEVRAELAAEGVRAEHRDTWIAARGGIEVDDMVVHDAGRMGTIAERVLFATGRRMGAAELAEVIGTKDRIAELTRILVRDRRFVCVGADGYELAEWGGVAVLETPEVPEAAAGCTSIDGRWWLRVPVAADVVSGTCQPVPVDLVDAMSLVSSNDRAFTSRYGPVIIFHDGAVAACGPLRHVALACGAQPGDELWLGFHPSGDVAVRLISRDDLQSTDEPPVAQGA
jgi:hypothetical protein